MTAGRTASFLAGVVAIGAVAALWVPERVAGASLCHPGYSRSQRLPPSQYYPIAKEAYRLAGIPWSEREGLRLDHRIPLCLGGTWDQSNLQIQTIADAAAKDRVEAHACRLYCSGQITIDDAEWLIGNWRRYVWPFQPFSRSSERQR